MRRMLWRVGAGSARSEGKGEERRARGTEVSLSFDVFLCIHSVVLFSSFPFFFLHLPLSFTTLPHLNLPSLILLHPYNNTIVLNKVR